MSGRFQLYRHFDADGTLLYVGQSNNCFARGAQKMTDHDLEQIRAILQDALAPLRSDLAAIKAALAELHRMERDKVRRAPRNQLTT
jgi:hypothetical protein